MSSLGGSIGDTYAISPFRVSRNQPVESTGGPANIGAPADKLEVVDGLTESYYNAWANVQNFAKTAWKNYGIDVTAPDLSDPTQQRMNRLFLKALSKAKETGNNLQVGRENEQMIEELKAKYADYVAPGQVEGEPTQLGGYNIGLTSGQKESLPGFRTDHYSSTSYNRAMGEWRDAVTQTEAVINDPNASQEQVARAENYLTALEGNQPRYHRAPVGTKPKDGTKHQTDASELYGLLLKDVGNKESTALDRIDSIGKDKVVSKQWTTNPETGNQALEIGIRTTGDGVALRYIDIQDFATGSGALAEFMREVGGKNYEGLDSDKISKEWSKKQELGVRGEKGGVTQPITEDDVANVVEMANTIQKSRRTFWGLKGDQGDALAESINSAIRDGENISITVPNEKDDTVSLKNVSSVEFSGGIGFGSDEIVLNFGDGTSYEIDLDELSGREEFASLLKDNATPLARFFKGNPDAYFSGEEDSTVVDESIPDFG